MQAMLELALNFGGGPVQIRDIANSQRIPIRFLEQLLLVLKRSGVVTSTRGKSGGYILAKHPSEITVLDLIEVLEGPIELANKKIKKMPVLYDIFERIQNNLKKDLKETTLEDLVFKKRQKDRAYIYNI